MRSYRTWLRPILVGIALSGGAAPAAHAVPTPAPFTWNPASAGLGGSAFTADTISMTGYVRDVSQPDGSDLAQRIEVITGFSLNGSPVTPTGFGSNYGLYFEFVDQGFGGPPPHILNFTSQDMMLKADPGNHNGAVSSTVSGIGFTNTGPTGAADDIPLATGSMVTASLFLDLSTTPPILNGDGVGTFIPAAGQAGFFQGGSGLLHNFASNPATLLTMTPLPDGTTISNFNGYVATAQFVPEPGSIVLLGTGLLGLLTFSRRSHRGQ
jgi:hypothetical protein